MKGTKVGLGLVFGAGLGLMVGVLLDELTYGIIVGSAAGLLVGAVLEMNSKK